MISAKSARLRRRAGCGSTGWPAQADSRLRPLARRAERMARPARVRMRRRKPWVLARRRLFGWKVRLLTEELQTRSPRGSRATLTKDDERHGRPRRTARPRYGGVRAGSNPALVRALVPSQVKATRREPGTDSPTACGEPLERLTRVLLACRHRLFPPRSRPGRRTRRACVVGGYGVGLPASSRWSTDCGRPCGRPVIQPQSRTEATPQPVQVPHRSRCFVPVRPVADQTTRGA